MSAGSKGTFAYQGGIMTPKEAENFEESFLFAESLRVRKYDELAKEPNIKINSISHYKQMLHNFLLK